MQPEQSAVIRHKVNDDKIFIYYSLASEITGSILAAGNDSNLLIVFYVQIMPDDFVMQLHR
ncbi:hypothetical protein NQ234_24720, partial [Escherichia coli]|nr:hypothetical protein [Escherichia coli]